MNDLQVQELLARVAELETKNATLEQRAKTNGLKMKVSQKGAVSVYGMGRFPVTLYADQWKRIDEELIQSGDMDNFINENKANLTFKQWNYFVFRVTFFLTTASKSGNIIYTTIEEHQKWAVRQIGTTD